MGINIDSLTRDEKSLLLFCEASAVDSGGRLKAQCMNQTDRDLLEKFKEQGLLNYGRVCRDDIGSKGLAMWVELSDDAWSMAHRLRKERGERVFKNRTWKKTEERG